MYDLLLIDGKHSLWRAADAHMELAIETEAGDRVETGAIYGFLSILTRVHQEYAPIMTVICWDDWDKGPAFRRAMYPDYKKRGSFDELPVQQQEFIKGMTKQQHQLMGMMDLMGIRQCVSPGWEADDVMGAIARRYAGAATAIYTGDRDLLQCVTPKVHVVRPLKKGAVAIEDPASVEAEWGVPPDRFVELKALMGDAGDNIPGAKGVGKVTAAKIMECFPTAAAAVEAATGEAPWPETLSESVRAKVAASAGDIAISRQLSEINCEAPLHFRNRHKDQKRVQDLFMKLKFKTMFIEGRLQRLMGMGD